MSILNNLQNKWPENSVPKLKGFKAYEIEKGKRILEYNDFSLIQNDNILLPFLGNKKLLDLFPSVVVDMGAINAVCNGAKITRPGIIQFDDFDLDDIVVIRDQQHGKNLAIGLALMDSNSARSSKNGYIINTIHYVSDKYWKSYKEINPSSL